jgi:integrase
MTKDSERREIPLNDTLRNVFEAQKKRGFIPYVFTNPETGKPYDNIHRSWRTALKNAGINDFRFHDLRHTFASHLVMDGQDLTTIKELLGHADISMTLRYAHLAPSHKLAAMARLDAIYNENELYKNYTIGG